MREKDKITAGDTVVLRGYTFPRLVVDYVSEDGKFVDVLWLDTELHLQIKRMAVTSVYQVEWS